MFRLHFHNLKNIWVHICIWWWIPTVIINLCNRRVPGRSLLWPGLWAYIWLKNIRLHRWISTTCVRNLKNVYCTYHYANFFKQNFVSFEICGFCCWFKREVDPIPLSLPWGNVFVARRWTNFTTSFLWGTLTWSSDSGVRHNHTSATHTSDRCHGSSLIPLLTVWRFN